MTEPLLQADARVDEHRLWDKAPAWRNLAVAASLLTLAAVATPLLLPPQEAGLSPHPAPALAPVTPVPVAPQAAIVQPTAPVRTAMAPHHAAPAASSNAAADTGPVCAMRQTAVAPRVLGDGVVLGFEDPAQAQAAILNTEANSGGKIDPDYIQNQRVMVQSPTGQVRAFILPKGMTVQIGDRVTVQSAYRNMALACNYVPVQIASDLGPTPEPAPAAP